MTKPTAKSTSAEIVEEIGTNSLGKYTFEIRLDWLTMLVTARFRALANKFHGNRAVKAKIG